MARLNDFRIGVVNAIIIGNFSRRTRSFFERIHRALRLNESSCDCLSMIKYSQLVNVSRHSCPARAFGQREYWRNRPSLARANMTAISISVYDIGTAAMRRVNVRRAVPHYFIWIPCRRDCVFFRILNTFITSLHSRSRYRAVRPSFTFIARNSRSIRNKFHFA